MQITIFLYVRYIEGTPTTFIVTKNNNEPVRLPWGIPCVKENKKFVKINVF